MAAEKVENLKSLGDAAFKHKQYHQAVAYYTEGMEVDSRDEELLGCRCAVYHKLSMFNEAVKDSERLINLVPGQAKGHYMQALALENLGTYKKSLHAYLSAYEIDPRHPSELLSCICRVSQHLDSSNLSAKEKQKQTHFEQLVGIGKRMFVSKEFQTCVEVLRTALRVHVHKMFTQEWLNKSSDDEDETAGREQVGKSSSVLKEQEKVREILAAQEMAQLKQAVKESCDPEQIASGAGLSAAEDRPKSSLGDSAEMDASLQMSALLYSAQALVELQKYPPALTYAKEALEIALKTKNMEYEMKSYIKLANIYYKQGNYTQAISFNAKILAVGADLGKPEDSDATFWNSEVERKAQWNLCACYRILGDYQKALEHGQRYLEIVKIIDQDSLIDANINLGQIEVVFENYEKALDYFKAELSICKKFKDKVRIGYAYGHIGNAYAASGNFKQALAYHNQHLQVAKATGDKVSEAQMMMNLGDMYRLSGELEKAGEYYDKQMRMARIDNVPSLEHMAYKSWGRCCYQSKLYHKAQYLVENALNVAIDSGDFEEQLECQELLAKILKELSQYESARRHYNHVITVLESRLHMMRSAQILEQGNIQLKLSRCYKDLLEILANMNCFNEALEISEHCNSRVMMNILMKQQVLKPHLQLKNSDLLPLNLSEILQAISKQDGVVLYFTVIDSGIILWVITPNEGVTLVHRFRNTPGKILEQVIKRHLLDLHSAPFGSEADYFCEHRSFSMRPATSPVNEVSSSRPRGTTSRQSLLSKSISVSSLSSRLTPLQELYSLLLSPIADLLTSLPKDSKLSIIADSYLNLVPFASLQNFSGKFLHENFIVCVLPCVGLLLHCAEHRTKPVTTGDVLVAGNPVIDNVQLCEKSWTPPIQSENIEMEINLVSSILGADPLSGAQATKDDVLKALPKASVIHLATLGDLANGSLVFTPNVHYYGNTPTPESYLVTLEDLSDLDLQASVAVISAGLGCSHDLDSLGGFSYQLATTLLTSGVRAVLMLMWSVSSPVLQQVWYHFYQELDKGSSVVKALNNTLLACQEEDGVQLSDLAAFQVIGFDTQVNIQTLKHCRLDECIDEQKAKVPEILPQTASQVLKQKFPPVSVRLLQIQKHFVELLENHSKRPKVLPQIKSLLRQGSEVLVNKTPADSSLTTQVTAQFLEARGCKDLLHAVGFSFQPSGVLEDQLMVIYPHWDLDRTLESAATISHNLCDILVTSDYSAFTLSRVFSSFDRQSLQRVGKLFQTTTLQPEKLLKVEDPGISVLWMDHSMQNLLTSIGYYVIGGTLLFNKTSTNRHLLGCVFDTIQSLLDCYAHEEANLAAASKLKLVDGFPVQMSSLSPTLDASGDLRMSTPWMTKKSGVAEKKLKTQVTRRLVDINKEFRNHKASAHQWHKKLLDMQDPIIPVSTRQQNNVDNSTMRKVKVLPGLGPSCGRVPVDRKPDMTPQLVDTRRTGIHKVFEKRYMDITFRRKHEVKQLYLPHLVMAGTAVNGKKNA